MQPAAQELQDPNEILEEERQSRLCVDCRREWIEARNAERYPAVRGPIARNLNGPAARRRSRDPKSSSPEKRWPAAFACRRFWQRRE